MASEFLRGEAAGVLLEAKAIEIKETLRRCAGAPLELHVIVIAGDAEGYRFASSLSDGDLEDVLSDLLAGLHPERRQ